MHLQRTSFNAHLCATLGLTLLLACGGGHGGDHAGAPPKATGLRYRNPVGTGWLLVQNPASTPTHLVLDLQAPAASAGQGVGFTLVLEDSHAQWAKVAAEDAQCVANRVYDLGVPASTQLCRGVVHGGELSAGVYQKGMASPVTYRGNLVSVAIDFKAGEGLEAGTTIPLRVAKAKHVAVDGTIADIQPQFQVGTLTAN